MRNKEVDAVSEQLYRILRGKKEGRSVVKQDVEVAIEALLASPEGNWGDCAFELATAIRTALNENVRTDVLLDLGKTLRRCLGNLVAIESAKRFQALKDQIKLEKGGENGGQAI